MFRGTQSNLLGVLDRDFSVLRNAAGLDADSFGTAVMPETNRAMLNVPSGIDLPTRLTHKTQCTDVSASLTEFLGNIYWAGVSDQHGGNISADPSDLVRTFEVYRFSADLVLVLADSRLRNS
jgi:hypothetical protein